MKIWKLAEYSANRDYDLQKIWRKNKQDYFFDDTPGEIRALHERFDNSWVYREVTSIPVSQPWSIFFFCRKTRTRSDVVIVVLGDDTHSASSVEKEITFKNQLNKPGFQIRPKRRTSGSVRGAGDRVVWNWKQIDAKITECLKT